MTGQFKRADYRKSLFPADKLLHTTLVFYTYEGRSKSFATQYDAQMTQAKFL